ncbi:hypothetical protein Q8A73_003526 [Channa argus]|nr:hypothetical protein Q8A73_003526 [Channa argus]
MEDCEGITQKAPVTPEPGAKKPKKVLSEEARRVKRENDRERARTRVNLGQAFIPWKRLRDKNGFFSHQRQDRESTSAKPQKEFLNWNLVSKSLQNCCKWTNLPDDDKEDIDFHINGMDTTHGQTNTTMVPK